VFAKPLDVGLALLLLALKHFLNPAPVQLGLALLKAPLAFEAGNCRLGVPYGSRLCERGALRLSYILGP
jgi:hypothetical protein